VSSEKVFPAQLEMRFLANENFPGAACQTAPNRDPGSASNRNPSPALGQACAVGAPTPLRRLDRRLYGSIRLIIAIIKRAIHGCIHKQKIGCQIPLSTAFYDAKFRCRQAGQMDLMLLK
jgi:hypothetical protein